MLSQKLIGVPSSRITRKPTLILPMLLPPVTISEMTQ
jgi:hypothetical protein